MKTKQKNLKVLEVTIDEKSEFFSYADKNYLLLKNFLFELSGNVDSEVREFLDSRNISYVTSDVFKSQEMFRKKSSSSLNELLKGKKQKDVKPQKLTIYEPLRSGQEIEEDIDLIIFGRINSGSRVISSKNIEVFNEIDGTVICNGDYLVIKSINSGSVMFRDTILSADDFNGSYKMVYFEDNEVKMKDL
jgi:septum site-determining protein MinC